MGKLTLEELKKLRESKQKEMSLRDTSDKNVHIIIGMGTCGIAAGAKDAYSAFVDELAAHNLGNVTVKQTGCMGLCHAEPTVEVIMPEMPRIIYGNVNAQVARDIVRKHVLGKILVNDHVFDRPAIDIVEGGGN
ncbi:MAG: (2Fe-2S) ferredoxin domain-containing protein [Spirochaetales bacterium]|nr:(2Fe-2S) ferredoxin domain-containing protein [Spirochaetales bacterium]